MQRKLFTLLSLVIVSLLAYLSQRWLPYASIDNIFASAAVVSVLYAVFSIGMEGFFIRRIQDSKTRYGVRKAISILLIVLIAVILLRIWVPDPQALLVAYGLVAAGIAVSLQDVVKNLAGSITIFLSGTYHVGNRIKLNGTVGDVIDIGLFATTLLEVGEWIDADQATGRISVIPNGAVLNQPVHNYTKHHKYLWDELSIVVTAESDWSEAMRLLGEIGHEHTNHFIAEADASLSKLERYYYVEGHVLDPNVYVTPVNDGYQLTLRYVVDAWKRRSTKSNIWGHIIRVFTEQPRINIAPPTLAQVEYPLPAE